MLSLIAPEIKSSTRKDWIESHLSSHGYDFILTESPHGRRELLQCGYDQDILQLNEHKNQSDEKEALSRLKNGERGALVSDGGFPCLGDPGAELVRKAHLQSSSVTTEGVHSYILAALLMSGCDGNRFSFLGYPPRKSPEREQFFSELKNTSTPMTTILMEPPYRSLALIESLIPLLRASSSGWFSFSVDVGLSSQNTFAGDGNYWKKNGSQIKEELGPKPLGVAVLQLSP